MINMKSRQKLDGDDFWAGLAWVDVKGVAGEQSMPQGATQGQGEQTVQSWKNIAVLSVTPDIEVYFGFMSGGPAYFLNVPIKTHKGQFGVHLGDGDVKFFVIPKDLKSRPELKLVEVASVDDSKYKDLPLY